MHSCAALILFNERRHVREIKSGVDTVRIHIHSKRDNIDIARALTVSEQRSLNSVRACEQCKLRIGNTGSSVVVRVERYGYMLAVVQILTHIFYLRCVHMRHAHLDGHGKIDYDVVVLARLEHIEHSIADLERIFGLGTRK